MTPHDIRRDLRTLAQATMPDTTAAASRIEERLMQAHTQRARFNNRGMKRFTLPTLAFFGLAAAAGATAVMTSNWTVEPYEDDQEILRHSDDDPATPDFAIVVDSTETDEILDILDGGGMLLTSVPDDPEEAPQVIVVTEAEQD